MLDTYKPAQALITIPIIPYVNKSYSWSCSFPVSVYGAQTSTNPYVFPVTNGVKVTCGNGIAAASRGSVMWVPPAPTDPIAYSFRMFRNYDGRGHSFGDMSISAVSSDPASLSLYAAERSSDNAVTLLAINKTPWPITSSIALNNLSALSSARVYLYSAVDLKSIVPLAEAWHGPRLGQVAGRVRADGEVVMARAGKPVARLTPILGSESRSGVRFGRIIEMRG